MPTFDRTHRFISDYSALTPKQKAEAQIALKKFLEDLPKRQSRKGLRVKHVQKTEGVFEMTWADDGRATFEYGDEVVPGEPHVIWRRIGTHDIF